MLRAWAAVALFMAGCSAPVAYDEAPLVAASSSWTTTVGLQDAGVVVVAAAMVWAPDADEVVVEYALNISSAPRSSPAPDAQVVTIFLEEATGEVGLSPRQEQLTMLTGGLLYAGSLGRTSIHAAGQTLVDTSDHGGQHGSAVRGARIIERWDVPMRVVAAIAWSSPPATIAELQLSLTARDGNATFVPGAPRANDRAGFVSTLAQQEMDQTVCGNTLYVAACASRMEASFETHAATWISLIEDMDAGRLHVGVFHDGQPVMEHLRTPPDGQPLRWTHRAEAGEWEVIWTMAGASAMLSQPYLHVFWADLPTAQPSAS